MTKPPPPCLLCGGVMEPFPNHPIALSLGQSISIMIRTYRCSGCGFLRFYDKDIRGPVGVSSPNEVPTPPPMPPDTY